MSDRERVIDLFKSLGIGYGEDLGCIVIEPGNDKVEGHPGFFLQFSFHTDGSFDRMGLWEEGVY